LLRVLLLWLGAVPTDSRRGFWQDRSVLYVRLRKRQFPPCHQRDLRAAQIVKQNGELELNGVGAVTAFNQCWLEGVPEILGVIGIQMLQQSDKIIILYMGNEVRHVRMNQPHPEHVRPSWYGDSVGHLARDCSFNSQSRMKAPSPHPGRRP
jgi:hypothetical protein